MTDNTLMWDCKWSSPLLDWICVKNGNTVFLGSLVTNLTENKERNGRSWDFICGNNSTCGKTCQYQKAKRNAYLERKRMNIFSEWPQQEDAIAHTKTTESCLVFTDKDECQIMCSKCHQEYFRCVYNCLLLKNCCLSYHCFVILPLALCFAELSVLITFVITVQFKTVFYFLKTQPPDVDFIPPFFWLMYN